jgi:hypothetical protein
MRLALQTGAYTISCMLLAAGVVFLLALYNLRPAVAIPVTVAATALVLVGVIAVLGLPPPTAVQYVRPESALRMKGMQILPSFRPTLGTHYFVLALAFFAVAAGAMARFYALRKHKGLGVDE